MANIKTRLREITIVQEESAFKSLLKRFTGEKPDYDFQGLATIRKILSNHKAKILHVIKNSKPKSLYELSKILKRDFKSVITDVKLLEKFGFIDMISEKKGKRKRHRPIIIVDNIQINIKV